MRRPAFEVLANLGYQEPFAALLGAAEPSAGQISQISRLITSVDIHAWPGKTYASAVVARFRNDQQQVCVLVANDAAQVQFEAMQLRILSCLPALIGIKEPYTPAAPLRPRYIPNTQTLAWTLAAGLERLEDGAGAFRGSPDVARDVAAIRDLFNGLVFGLTLGTLDVEQFYTLIGAPGSGGATSTSAPNPGRAPISSEAPVSSIPDGPLTDKTGALSHASGNDAGGGSV